jgi:two-component system NarL family sensor kinase
VSDQVLAITRPEPFPPLPAAVEVAAYRIIQEALTNVVRHASARTCSIQLVVGAQLYLAITDDGIGLPHSPGGIPYQTGVGLVSMRERAEELGGTCRVDSEPGGGTRVQAWLPLAKE